MVDNGGCGFPSVFRGDSVADGFLGVGETADRRGFTVPMTDFTANAYGGVIAGNGVVMVSKMVVYVAEAVPDCALGDTVT